MEHKNLYGVVTYLVIEFAINVMNGMKRFYFFLEVVKIPEYIDKIFNLRTLVLQQILAKPIILLCSVRTIRVQFANPKKRIMPRMGNKKSI